MQYNIPGNPKTEASFTTAFLKIFKKEWWAYKIPDVGFTQKPFDWFWLCEAGVIFCEAKYIDGLTFNFSKFQPSQLKSLRTLTDLVQRYHLKKVVHPVLQVYSSKTHKYVFVLYSDILDILDDPEKENAIKLDFDKCYFSK